MASCRTVSAIVGTPAHLWMSTFLANQGDLVAVLIALFCTSSNSQQLRFSKILTWRTTVCSQSSSEHEGNSWLCLRKVLAVKVFRQTMKSAMLGGNQFCGQWLAFAEMIPRKMLHFREYVRGKNGKIKDAEFMTALKPLKEEANRGFSEEEIKTLVSALITIPLPLTKFSALIQVIVPETSVPQNAIQKMAIWAFSNHKTKRTCSILAMQWIIAMIEYELTNKSYANCFFDLFFDILHNPFLEKDACKLVYALINPADVARWRINTVFQLHLNNGKQRHTNALLLRFKAFRPELMPETVANQSVASAFKATSVLLRNNLAAARQRKLQADGASAASAEEIVWGGMAARRGRRGFGKIDTEFIPPVNVIHLGSQDRRKKKTVRSVMQYRTMDALVRYQLTVHLPCQAMSLLDNDIGLHLIAYGTSALQERFSDTLYHRLSSLLRLPDTQRAYKEAMLERLATLEDYMKQGIPIITVVLLEYLHLWNGDDLHRQIYRLLEWTTFHSLEELEDFVFAQIHRFFMQGDDERKCLIVATMRRFVENLFLSERRVQRQLVAPFLAVAEVSDGAQTLDFVVSFVGGLVTAGLTQSRRHLLLLDQCLRFYHTVSLLEETSGLPIWTVMPPAVFYRGLFARNPHALGRALDLLFRYLTVDKARLRALTPGNDFRTQTKTVAKYANDVGNCLWDGKAFSAADAGFIFAGQTRAEATAFGRQDEIDSAFTVPNNQALAPLLRDRDAEGKAWRRHIDAILPQLRSVIDVCNKRLEPK